MFFSDLAYLYLNFVTNVELPVLEKDDYTQFM